MVEPVRFDPDEQSERAGWPERDAEPPRAFRPHAGDEDMPDEDTGDQDDARNATAPNSRRRGPWDEQATRERGFDRRYERRERWDGDPRDEDDFDARRSRPPQGWDDVAPAFPTFPAQWQELAEGFGLMQATLLRATAEVLRGLAAAADWEAARQERQRRGRPGGAGGYGRWDGYSGRDPWDDGRGPRRERIYPE